MSYRASPMPAQANMVSEAEIETAAIPLQKRVALLTNILPPYLLPVMSDLAKKVAALRIFLSAPMERDRPWDPNWGELDVTLQKSLCVNVQQKYPQGFATRVERHLPYDTLPLLLRHRPDVVISAQLGFRTIQSIVYRSIIRNSRLVVWVDASEHTEKRVGPLLTILRRFLLRYADAVLVVGKSGRRYLQGLGVLAHRTVEVPYVVDASMFRACDLQRNSQEARRLLYVGQLIARKGIVQFLQELILWTKRHPSQTCEFWLIGDGPLRTQLEALNAPSNLTVKFFANVPYQCLPDFYAQGGICVLPTLADTWGLVVNEALAAGLPVIGSIYSQAVEELIEHGRNGWRYCPDSQGATQRVLDQALNSSDGELAAMRAYARKSANHLTPQYAASCFLRAIAMAVSNSIAPGAETKSYMAGER
jgi:glycosyltransferase involved in cell wall biosynthesis